MEYFPFIHKIEKKKEEQQISLYIEEYYVEPEIKDEDEDGNTVIILQL